MTLFAVLAEDIHNSAENAEYALEFDTIRKDVLNFAMTAENILNISMTMEDVHDFTMITNEAMIFPRLQKMFFISL